MDPLEDAPDEVVTLLSDSVFDSSEKHFLCRGDLVSHCRSSLGECLVHGNIIYLFHLIRIGGAGCHVRQEQRAYASEPSESYTAGAWRRRSE